jgi:hypothetical protein
LDQNGVQADQLEGKRVEFAFTRGRRSVNGLEVFKVDQHPDGRLRISIVVTVANASAPERLSIHLIVLSDNGVSLIKSCPYHPTAAYQVFEV